MTENKYNNISLAAWLHDIDIFSQRAGVGTGEKFLQTVKDCFPADVEPTEVIRLAGAWRNPSSYDERLIAHGDKLSRGGEDSGRGNEAEFNEPLVHLVSTVHIKKDAPPNVGYCQLKPLEGGAVFPLEKEKVKTGKEKYLELWKDFEKDFRALAPRRDYTDFIQSLDTLLERYCWCIPVSAQNRDISLYQHLKMSAAFAGTLYLYHKNKNTETKEALDANDEKAFLFVQGDVSGIQKYIFDLKITDNNAKLLRARSFQIWTLGELMAGYLTGKLGVSRENIITSAGAKFLLLVPNVSEVTEKLPALRLEIERFFLREFAGKLAFVLDDGVPASCEGVQKGKKVQDLIDAIGKNGYMAKQKKMQAVLGKDGHVLEELYNGFKDNAECEYCGTFPADPELKVDDRKRRCIKCDNLIDVGGDLVKTDTIFFDTEKLSNLAESSFADLVNLKSDGKFGYLTGYKAGFPLMSLPYAAPVKKNNENILLTFEEIAKKAEGDKKLAMFKADIDSLSDIFSSPWDKGTKDKKDSISFSQYALLSRQLHYFFTAYVSDFINGKDGNVEYKDKIYTVFSGGDDLCVLGAWDAVMRFARDFQKKLSAFTNNNPSVTLSGGIALADPKLPVRAIADMAEEALKQAKNRKNPDDPDGEPLKNAVSVFGVTVGWDEYEQSLQDAEKIKQYMDNRVVSTALVYKMIDFANRAKEFSEGDLRIAHQSGLWMSNFRYLIARNINPEHEDALNFFRKFVNYPEKMEKSRIAVSYALYINREGKKNTEEENNA